MSGKVRIWAESPDDGVMSVSEIEAYPIEREAAEAGLAVDTHPRTVKARPEYIECLSQRIEIAAEGIHRPLRNAKAAAERGERDVLIGRFPVGLRTGRGRAPQRRARLAGGSGRRAGVSWGRHIPATAGPANA